MTTDFFTDLSQIFRNTLENGITIDVNDKLQELGINSLSFIKIVVSIESAFSVEFDDEYLNFEKFNTVNDLITYIIKNSKSE